MKVLFVGVRNLEEFRSQQVGTTASGWKEAQACTI
jgi:hypothetical protein